MVGEAPAWELVSAIDGIVHRVDPDAPMAHAWTDYIVGVIRELRRLRSAPRGARVAVASTVPVGAGLSSSAALTVAAAKALSALAGRRLSAARLIDVASLAEHEQVGVRGGRMDQTIAVLARRGTALLVETDTGITRPVPMAHRIWVIETGVVHRLTAGQLNQRHAECEAALLELHGRWPALDALAHLPLSDLPAAVALLPDVLGRRVRHIVTEAARVRTAVAALEAGDLPALGRTLFEGHESLRCDYESSCAEADLLVASAARHGALGARLTGAGWGGAVLMLASPAREREILRRVSDEFAGAYGRRPVAWSTAASAGVRREATEW